MTDKLPIEYNGKLNHVSAPFVTPVEQDAFGGADRAKAQTELTEMVTSTMEYERQMTAGGRKADATPRRYTRQAMKAGFPAGPD